MSENQGTQPPSEKPQIQTRTLGKLAEALAKAQLSIKAPLKKHKVDFVNNKNQRVKYSYADLADVIEAVKPLHDQGLAYTHQLGFSGQNYGLRTTLIHSSGEFIETWYPLPDPARSDISAQGFGSALTYARRYSISSLVGIASEEDDDGDNAPPTKPPQNTAARPPQQASKPPVKNHAPGAANPPEKPKDPIDKALDQDGPDQNPADYICNIGKHNVGKRIGDFKQADLEGFVSYLRRNNPNGLRGQEYDFVFFAEKHLQTIKELGGQK